MLFVEKTRNEIARMIIDYGLSFTSPQAKEIQNMIELKLKDDLSIFRRNCPSPSFFSSTNSSTNSMALTTASTDSPIGSLSDLLALCHQS